MSKKRKSNCFFQCFIYLILFIFVLIVCYGAYQTIINKGFLSTETSGWMQVIGSILAIMGAFFIAKHQSDMTLQSIFDSQKIADETRRKRILAVVLFARTHAENIGNAISDKESLKIYDVYDKTIINNVVSALSSIPLFEVGHPSAISALLALRDQFIFLGSQVEIYIAGPWKHDDIGPELEKYRDSEYKDCLFKTATQAFATNVTKRVELIIDKCGCIEDALS